MGFNGHNFEWSRRTRIFLQHKVGVVGAIIIILFAFMAIFAPFITTGNPNETNLMDIASPPSWKHLLGTDELGRDVWTRVVYASRVSLTVGFLSTIIAVFVGTSIGIISGYFSGWVDMILQRIIDAMLCFPTLLIAITIVALVKNTTVYTLVLVIGLLGWPGLARLIRSKVLSMREEGFIEAIRAIGASNARILVKHVFPNTLSIVVVAATFGVAGAIITEASLSFLGLGVRPPTPSWGRMLYSARSVSILVDKPWMWVAPGIMISLCVLSINFIGDALRDAMDPRYFK